MKQTTMCAMAGLALLLNIASEGYAAPITTIDQQNLGPATGTNGGVVFGQSFTPTFPSIDAIEFLMAGFNDTVVVQILDGVAGFDGLGGLVLATSTPVFVKTPGFHQTVHFDFPLRVDLIPGQTYVARLSAPGGIQGVSHTSDLYSGGQSLHEGFAINAFPSTRDMIFSEGLTNPIPEPTTGWSFGLGLVALVAQSRPRLMRRWRRRATA